MMGNILFYTFCSTYFVYVSSKAITDSVIVPCKKDDEACMIKSANIAIPFIAGGIPELNIDPIDPLDPGNVEGEFPNLIYKLTNNVVSGYRKCEMASLKVNLDSMKLIFSLNCPSMVFDGRFELSDDTTAVNGTFNLVSGKYNYEVKADIEKVTSGDDESHMSIKTFEVAANRLEPLKFHIKKFGSGPTSEMVTKSELKKYEDISELVRNAHILATFNKIFESVNKLLQTVSFDDLFIN